MEWIMYVIWFLTDIFKLAFYLSLTVVSLIMGKYLYSTIKSEKLTNQNKQSSIVIVNKETKELIASIEKDDIIIHDNYEVIESAR